MKTKKLKAAKVVLLAGISFMLLMQAEPLNAQYVEKEDKNYGNTPDKQVPYANYQDAYKKHFLEEQAFTGAGRDKP